jgi:hypothetical protein
MNIGLAIAKHHELRENIMPGLKAMFLDEGHNKNIRCRFICDYCKVESNVHSNARLFSEIEKTHPVVVVMDLDLYAKIDGIETSRMIRSQFDVPVMYV